MKFIKKLTAAEVGNTKTHEVYIRMPNDFDFENFFNHTHKETGSVIEVNFPTRVISRFPSPSTPKIYDLRFVYFANSNKEKRLPGLGALFKEYQVKEGDIVCLEKTSDNTFLLSFLPPNAVQIYNGCVFIEDNLDNTPLPSIAPINTPLQLIYYGAPGTGKSYTIDKVTNENNSVRTTFHPDSDYAGFVGSYKPTMEDVPMSAFVGTNVLIAQPQGGHSGKERKIVYKFVPQAFLKAYVEAWKRYADGEPFYLVIEEINRGNCAQIFGDLFQLLDRNNAGSSSYAINADESIAQFLREDEQGFGSIKDTPVGEAIRNFKLRKDHGGEEAIGESILNGNKLLLPPNLRIWATMNTSDQSLFPIDSAFKRRWDWKYIKISDSGLGYRIAVNGNQYDWWEFVKAINNHIGTTTSQEDKKLGYFFVKASQDEEGNNIISADKFLSKVLFFLYGDVYKDYGLDDAIFKGEDDKQMEFSDYFDEQGNADESKIEQFLRNLKLEPLPVAESQDMEGDAPVKSKLRAKVNGTIIWTITYAFYQILRGIASKYTFEELQNIVSSSIKRDVPMIKSIPSVENYQKENGWFNYNPLTSKDGVTFVTTNQWKKEYLPEIKEFAKTQDISYEDLSE